MEKMPAQTKTDRRELAAVPDSPHASIVDYAATAKLSQEQVDLLKRTFCAGATDDELKLFIHFCQSNNVDALNREAWFRVAWSKKKGKDGRDIVDENGKAQYERRPIFGLSRGAVQKRLMQNADFAGLESGVIYSKDTFEADLGTGELKHVIKILDRAQRGLPLAAWCRIRRQGKAPLVRILYVSERKVSYSPMWDTMPDTMILKCVEMDTIRAAYPNQFANVYSEEEMLPAADESQPAGFLPVEAVVPVTPEIMRAESEKEPEAEGAKSAYITADQVNQIKVWMANYKLSQPEILLLIEHEFGKKIESVVKIIKPIFAQLAQRFARLNENQIDLDRETMRFKYDAKKTSTEPIRNESGKTTDELNHEANEEGVPF